MENVVEMLKNWNGSNLQLDGYRDGEEAQLAARAEHVAKLNPERALRFGTWESWSSEDVAYLLEELAGGLWWSEESTVSAGPALLLARVAATAALEGTCPDAETLRPHLTELFSGLFNDADEDAVFRAQLSACVEALASAGEDGPSH